MCVFMFVCKAIIIKNEIMNFRRNKRHRDWRGKKKGINGVNIVLIYEIIKDYMNNS